MKRTFLVVALVAVPLALYATHVHYADKPAETKYLTAPVEKGTVRSEINSTGTIKPLVEVLVGSQLSGTIKELYADFESTVKQGQLIALIDPATFKAEVDQAQADLVAARAALNQAQVTHEDERRTLNRKVSLISNQSISQSDYDAAKTRADRAEAQVLLEQARIEQLEAKLRKAQVQLDYTRIVAPVNGVVTSRNVDVGQTVAASLQAPVLFKIAEDLSRMQVHASVDEADIGRIEAGKGAVFTVPAFPDESFFARVKQVRNEPKVEQNVVTYTVVLDVDNSSLKLRPGMTANVTILVNEVRDVLLVPEAALRFKPASSMKERKDHKPASSTKKPPSAKVEPTVWKLDNGQQLVPVKVRIGLQGSEKVQVLSEELKVGDRVVVQAASKKAAEKHLKGLRF
ncbi:efflux RND transporter periplasmic adaptor subunit [Desulfomonile tiedjei]|uniref:RND family efflux transporter, MFP subunit n=1 Tax=Desulfomonile tiedjei (strain ATCC 49306 / DSM 6799 / DCB-1) TaxID=706587 RepID=I4CEQ2_DESTA|nr:efflux RND transporter periplasmic adaptor subunit [Desulfomonile tiedjei]AFM28043.1 RND family efflux transporter, MFP subunit [Desulfomonile tiedjei DSM 6799]